MMSISIDPKHFAELAVQANPSDKESLEDKAKDALELYLTAYKVAEKYARHARDEEETSNALRATRDDEMNLHS